MEIRDALALEREARQQTTYISLFTSKGMRRRMRIIIGALSLLKRIYELKFITNNLLALGFFSQWRYVHTVLLRTTNY